MSKKLTELTQEDIDSVRLPFSTQLKIFAKAVPLVALTYLLSIWEYLVVCVKIPGDVIEMITLEEILVELTKRK